MTSAICSNARPAPNPKAADESDPQSFPKGRWVKPVLLVDAEFRGKTADGLLRHPSFKGFRDLM
jgi:hypothetical protein